MRKVLLILAVVLWLTFPMSAEAASPWPNPPGQDKGGDATAISNATGIGVGIGIAGAKSDATAINVNSNYISTRTDLSVKNSNSQLQTQGQGQKQSIDAPMTNTTDISIVNPDPKRDLPVFPTYQAPQMTEFRGPYKDGLAGKFKPWRKHSLWTKEELSAMTSSFDSATCKVYPVRKKAEATESINVKASQEPVVCYLICTAENDIELWADAGLKALAAGGMTIQEEAYAVTFLNKASGWNLGFGGGVSVVGSGADDRIGGSAGGGTGIGSVKTEPVEKISALFSVR